MKKGRHYIADVFNVPDQYLTDGANIRKFLTDIAELSESTVVHVEGMEFDGGGYTMVITLAESHLSYHGWPEHKSFQLDLFTCSGNDLDCVRRHMEKTFGTENIGYFMLDRIISR